MKQAFEAWQWALGVLARSPGVVLALGVAVAVWGFAAYRWFGLPESSALVLLLALLWGVAQLLVAVTLLAGSASAASEAAQAPSAALRMRAFVPSPRARLLAAGAIAFDFLGLYWVLLQISDWDDALALRIGSFLTFHSNTAVSPVDVEKVLWVIEAWLGSAVAGFLLSYLIVWSRAGWSEARRRIRPTLKTCFFQTSLLTTVLSGGVFGGLIVLVVNWHPEVTPGFWDYAQAVLRVGVSLVLFVLGGLFWLLSLARLRLAKGAAATSPAP